MLHYPLHGCTVIGMDPGNCIVIARVCGDAEYTSASFVQEHAAAFETVVPGSEVRRFQSQSALFGCLPQIRFGAGGRKERLAELADQEADKSPDDHEQYQARGSFAIRED
jgi:hypothetical protein